MPILIFVFVVVLLAGVPVFIALAGSALLYTHFIAGLPDFVILHRMAGGLDSFPLLAVPFFILAGSGSSLERRAGSSRRSSPFLSRSTASPCSGCSPSSRTGHGRFDWSPGSRRSRSPWRWC